MSKAEEMRASLEKYVPKRVLKIMDEAAEENRMAIPYLEKIKPYKVYTIPETKTKGALYTIGDMMAMFRFGLHHNDEGKDEAPAKREPMFANGSILVNKNDERERITVKGYRGEHYKVKIDGERKYEFYSFDYVEDNYKSIE